MRVRPYTEADAPAWDALVARSATGTFLHTRRFLSYHGGRFADRSLLCEDERGGIVALFPAALKPGEPDCVVSHPGATYGGLVWERGLSPAEVEEALAAIVDHYRACGLERLEYRSVPPHLQLPYSQTDLYALWKRGATLAKRDLWNVVTLHGPLRYAENHRRAIARAKKHGVHAGVDGSEASYRAFYAVLRDCLAQRHGVAPVHTLEEMLALQEKFPRAIALWLARDGEQLCLAGCWVFVLAQKAWHTQYIASTAQGRERCATHLLLDALARRAQAEGVACVSFGSSTENEGRVVNAGLFRFKAGFGTGVVCHDTYGLRIA